ncbi:hypothetical protein RJ641_024545 [Dillenia turbinata]|uniref:Kinetochore protein Spc24 n=1 Tax=Dillenia turbinata TaxID=194707 RepID=A0AAN8ZQW0_9MAGN
MGELSRNVDFEKLISYGDDLVELLKDKKDLNKLSQCVENSKSLRLSCDTDFDETLSLVQAIVDEISDLEHQRVSVEERKKIQKKVEQEEQRLKTMLSMYASVTNIIPNLDDQMLISGHIVEKNKKVVEKFEFDPANVSNFNLCNEIWKMISM